MTDQNTTGDGEPVLTLQGLISARIAERGWSYSDLERRADGHLTKSRWQQIGTGVRLAEFPKPASLMAMSDALEVDVTAVILATARSLDLPVRHRGPDLAQLLPAGTDRLSTRMRDAILTLIRAAVAESLEFGTDAGADQDLNLEWPRAAHPQNWGRNVPARPNENHA